MVKKKAGIDWTTPALEQEIKGKLHRLEPFTESEGPEELYE
jgi:hypothetical protein